MLVLTKRPGTVSEIIDVPFARSRGPEVRREQRFLAIEDEIDDLLRARRAS